MLHFLDFDIFPHGSPSHLHTGSRKVTPVVHLKLDNHGIVERDLLPNAGAEQLLRWRIYHNGRLVRRDSAAGITHIDTNLGSGTYQVWMGVEGPNGFMPVSNLLEYPLFPDASGNKVVVPVDTDGDGMPDFFAALSATIPNKRRGAESRFACRTNPAKTIAKEKNASANQSALRSVGESGSPINASAPMYIITAAGIATRSNACSSSDRGALANISIHASRVNKRRTNGWLASHLL